MDKPATIAFYRRRLPHWQVHGRSYFVTFRLKDTIPQNVFLRMKNEYEDMKIRNPDGKKLLDIQRRHFLALEKILDSSEPERAYLRNPDVAKVISDGFAWIENNYGWSAVSYVIMPNHVHCLLVGKEAMASLSKTLKTLEGFTANKANEMLGLRGAFWAPESFDHWCRSAEDEEKVKSYIRNNPVKAGLVKSPSEWVWLK